MVIPKHLVASSLVLHSQHAFTGTAGTLDQELLDDLPRIHPNALGALVVRHEALGATLLTGRIADPYTHAPGLAVFAIVDGRRLGTACTKFDATSSILTADGTTFARFEIDVPPRADVGATAVAVGLIALDRRGYFLLGPDVADERPMPPTQGDSVVRPEC